jgi:hypothetical protein
MKNRTVLPPSLPLVTLLLVAVPAPAAAFDISSVIQGFVIGAIEMVSEKTIHAAVDRKTSPESEADRKVRENAQIEKEADDILAQYPEAEREARKPEVMMMLTKARVQPEPVIDRLGTVEEK